MDFQRRSFYVVNREHVPACAFRKRENPRTNVFFSLKIRKSERLRAGFRLGACRLLGTRRACGLLLVAKQGVADGLKGCKDTLVVAVDAKDDAQVTGTALTVVLAVIDRHARLSSEIGCNLGRIAKL